MNISSCHMACSTHQLSSRITRMRYSETSWIDLSSLTSTIFLSVQASAPVTQRTSTIFEIRKVWLLYHLCAVPMFLTNMASKCTRGRWTPSRIGPQLHLSKISKDSWVSQLLLVLHQELISTQFTTYIPPEKPAHPDPQLPSIIELDASTTGVRAVLSQQQGDSQRLHPCSFYSKNLSQEEQNYDIGNRELLAARLGRRETLAGGSHPSV